MPEKQSLLQRRSTEQAEIQAVPAIVHRVLNSPGQPLADETRTVMESHFGGYDFSQVRVLYRLNSHRVSTGGA